MQVFSSGIFGFLLFSRIFSGLGAGALTVVSPLFLSEIAPAKTRGMTVSIYMVMLLSFLSLGMSLEAVFRFVSRLTLVDRLLCQLRCQPPSGRHQNAVPTRPVDPADPSRSRLHRIVLHA